MSTPYEYNPDRDLFGRVLKRWFSANDLPQVCTEHWAKANNSPGPWASQMSQAMAGKIDPKPAFFVALGNFNLAVHEGNLGPINDKRTLERLKLAAPLMHDDGTVYVQHDFFDLFCGLINPPERFSGMHEELTAEFVREWQEALITGFRNVCRTQMLTPKEAFQLIVEKMLKEDPTINADDFDLLRDVLLDIRQPSVDEAARWRLRHPKTPLINVIEQLTEGFDEHDPLARFRKRLVGVNFEVAFSKLPKLD